MKHHYVLRLIDLANEEISYEFNCTKSQMDKVFFALAFASCDSTIKRGSLYLVCEAPRGVDLASSEQLVNIFECRAGFSKVSNVSKVR